MKLFVVEPMDNKRTSRFLVIHCTQGGDGGKQRDVCNEEHDAGTKNQQDYRLVTHTGFSLTCGRVDASGDVEVAESVSMGHVAAARLVVEVSALMVGQAASQRGLRHIPIKGGLPGFLIIQL